MGRESHVLIFKGSVSAAAGTFLFAGTGNFALACLGRAIVGGACSCWVECSAHRAIPTHWFPGRRFAMLSGLGLFFGNLGALVAQVPLRLAIDRFKKASVLGLA